MVFFEVSCVLTGWLIGLFTELLTEVFIEPLIDSCMHSFIHSFIVSLSRDAFVRSFNEHGGVQWCFSKFIVC